MSESDELQNDVEWRVHRCEELIDYQFTDQRLLEQCLTHASIARTRLESNERLEFLGDAILGAIVCESLYHQFPHLPEGELTSMKSVLVSRQTCARLATELGLGEVMIVGKGLRTRTGIPLSMLAGVFESLIAGLYLDGGIETARSLVNRCVLDEFDESGHAQHRNYKSSLQHLSQKVYGDTPVYRLIDEKGPDHAKCFKIAAVIGSQSFPAAWGPSKKEAEQRAAHNALAELHPDSCEDEPQDAAASD